MKSNTKTIKRDSLLTMKVNTEDRKLLNEYAMKERITVAQMIRIGIEKAFGIKI